MSHVVQDSLVDISFEFRWQSSHARHIERYLAQQVSFNRDMLPLGVKSRMLGLGVGDSASMDMDGSEIPSYKPGKVLDMPGDRFVGPESDTPDTPRIGRFYPKYFIASVPGTRPDSVTPFRVVGLDSGGFKADMNHPLSGKPVYMKGVVKAIAPAPTQPTGMTRWPEVMFDGPGMQARLEDTPTDFLHGNPFAREDETGDADFYAEPGSMSGVDRQARENLQTVYAELLSDNMDVLDLMAGAESHLSACPAPASVTGLGMNMSDMEANPALEQRVVHNLNEEPTLPFGDNAFHAVVCSFGVEYLINPMGVFDEVARVLKPGGVFVLAFSNHWISQKVIRIWTELFEFERMGLVSQHFVRSEKFKDVHTLSARGWPRLPEEGVDSVEDGHSDPIYAVWGYAL